MSAVEESPIRENSIASTTQAIPSNPSIPPKPQISPSTPPSSSIAKKINSALTLDSLVNEKPSGKALTTSSIKLTGVPKGPSKRSPKSDRGRFKPRAGEKGRTTLITGTKPKIKLNKTSKDKLTKGKGKNKKKAEKALAEILEADGMFDLAKEKAEASPPTQNEAEASPPTITGKVTIRYNHYTEEMELSHPEGKTGSIVAAEIVDLLALDFAFHGKFVTHLNKQQQGPKSWRKWQDKEGMIQGLKIGEEYWVDVDEDEDAEAAVERVVFNAAPAKNDPIGGKREVSLALKRTMSSILYQTLCSPLPPAHHPYPQEGCSCLFGNPCMESDSCKNWQGRFEVAKANGWKGY